MNYLIEFCQSLQAWFGALCGYTQDAFVLTCTWYDSVPQSVRDLFRDGWAACGLVFLQFSIGVLSSCAYLRGAQNYIAGYMEDNKKYLEAKVKVLQYEIMRSPSDAKDELNEAMNNFGRRADMAYAAITNFASTKKTVYKAFLILSVIATCTGSYHYLGPFAIILMIMPFSIQTRSIRALQKEVRSYCKQLNKVNSELRKNLKGIMAQMAKTP